TDPEGGHVGEEGFQRDEDERDDADLEGQPPRIGERPAVGAHGDQAGEENENERKELDGYEGLQPTADRDLGKLPGTGRDADEQRITRRRGQPDEDRGDVRQLRSSRRTMWLTFDQGTKMWPTTFSTSPPSITVRCTSKTMPTRSDRTTEQLCQTWSRIAISLRGVPAGRPCGSDMPPPVPLTLVVVLEAEVRDEVLSAQVAERVLELHELDEQVVLGVEAGRGHRALEVERQPLLDPAHPGARGEVEEEREVEHDGGGEDGVAAEEVHLDLHRVAHPAEDVDCLPAS